MLLTSSEDILIVPFVRNGMPFIYKLHDIRLELDILILHDTCFFSILFYLEYIGCKAKRVTGYYF